MYSSPEESLGDATARFGRAAARGNLNELQTLYDCHGSVLVHAWSEIGLAPIHQAIMNGNLQVIQFLVKQCGADVDAVDKLGYTPLSYASNSSSNSLRKLFHTWWKIVVLTLTHCG
jgi:ankyrin repeat protein